MFDNYLDKVLIIVLVCFLFVALIMPVIMKIALHIGAYKEPGERDIHKGIITRMGGIGIFMGFLLGYMLFATPSIQMNSILIGSIIIILTGLIDDIKPTKARYKLVGQLLAALVIVFYGNILLKDVYVLGLEFHFDILAYPITIFFIVACTNVINIIDGMDGLSSGIASIFFLTIGIIAFLQGRLDSLEIILTFIMLGSCLGHLLHNFYPAKTFLGDAGAYFIGFIISIISLLGFKGTMMTSLLVPLLVLMIPILDTLFAILRRLIKRKSIAEADKEHLHHQFLKLTNSQLKTVLIIYAIDALFSATSIFYAINDSQKATFLYIVLLIMVIYFVLHTSIISERVSRKVIEFEKSNLKRIKKSK